MKNPLTQLIAAFMVAASLASFGCARPPEAEKNAAEEAASSARAAGADRYASGDFAAMTEALRAAEEQMGAGKYSDAKTGYTKAREMAEKAVKVAEAQKAAIRSRAEQQLAETGKRWEELESKVKAAAKKLKADQKRAWEADAKAAAAAFEAAKAGAAVDPAAAMDKLAAVAQALGKWEEELKGLARPAPTKRAEKAGPPAVSGDMPAHVKAAYTFLLAWGKGNWGAAKAVAAETVTLKVGNKQYTLDVARGKADATLVLPFKGISSLRETGTIKGVTVDELALKVEGTEKRGKGTLTLEQTDGRFLVRGLTVE